ncbi:MAG: hypoxanthine phosphoribosyltransferase [Clostridium sp.]|uniref:hypoxanthine phosphoribosyltransferase n=1 Tax=Clostridium sp. DSM 8431 TaxID=1761781 RepID=UPI0008EF024D|nr:hypoxanthine phosphoribosyltransferase [Clostridium sp. DSM 8431]MCR4945066.1 hypoxanthine phosphoribosyltransferase [Clostridium sp.]SFU68192.1 hypoxanthine phosphoribosyltransferase [Clostridium sp. DSM 8431]
MREDIKEVLFSEERILKKVKEMGAKISEDYAGKDLIVVGVLKGSVLFTSDLLKNIDIPCEIDFMAVSSYGNATESSGVVRILKDLDHNIEGKDVLIVEDIVDSGITLAYLSKYLKARRANSIEIATLLNKPSRRKTDIHVKYIGFEVPDEFIVGYGIDYAEKYRNLPFIGTLKPEIYEK